MEAGQDGAEAPERTAASLRGDMLRGIAETLSARALLLAVNFAVSVVTARLLLEEGRGMLAMAMFIGSTGVQLAELGLSSASVYFSAKDKRLPSEVFATAMTVCLASGLAAAGAAYVLAIFRPDLFSIGGPLLVLALILIPFGQITSVTTNILLGIKDIRAFNVATIAPAVIFLALLCAMRFVGEVSPASVLAISILSSIPVMAWSSARILKRLESPPRFSAGLLKEMFGYGLRAYAAGFPAFLVFRVDIYLVFRYLGAAEAGIYSIAIALVNMLRILPQVVGQIILPNLCGMSDWEEKMALTKRTALNTFLAMAPVLAVSALVARPVISLIYGSAFAPAAAPFLYMLPGIFAWSLQSIVGKMLIADGYSGKIVGAWFAALGINVALNLALIPKMGLSGAAIALSASLIALCAAILSLVLLNNRKFQRNEIG